MAAFQAIHEPKQHAARGAETQETAVGNDTEPKQQHEANGTEPMQVDEAAVHAPVVDPVSSSASDAEPVVSSGASDEEESVVVKKQEHSNGGDVVDGSDVVDQDVNVALEQKPVEPLKVKKPVLKREFKEINFMYYEETVAIFCVRDFLASKKMSQGILNDQVRSLRVNGSYAGKQLTKKPRVHDPEIKAKIKSVLSKSVPYSPRQA